MMIPFQHRQSAHCESGVTANLLTHHGLPLSEAMLFGIGSGLFFGYFPFVRLAGLPLTTFRAAPGRILRKVAKRLRLDVRQQTFKEPALGTAQLDRLLSDGIPVGAQTGAFWLPYFPPALRFHFNMHNLVVFGRENGSYHVSDPVFPEPVTCPVGDLERARFAKGPMAPRGRLYWLDRAPARVELEPAILAGIEDVCRVMTRLPIPLMGTRGIRYLGRQVETWPRRLGARRASLYLGQVIRMQEEIGTGGGGFRFVFAAFLQEVAGVLDDERYRDLSARMTTVGDRWRDFAAAGARHCKGRQAETEDYGDLAQILYECADKEHALLSDLARVARDRRR